MNVYLTFDTEIWCNSWKTLERDFLGAFERYVYGRSPAGDYALPHTLEVLQTYGLLGVFFVEPLFSGRFGLAPLQELVGLINEAGQELQLHVHPEWTDEMRAPPISVAQGKRQHLTAYTRAEQTALIAWGLQRLEEAGAAPIQAFRAGSYAANLDTLAAVSTNGLRVDTSLNQTADISGDGIRATRPMFDPFMLDGLIELPVSVFRDGRGRLRHAQLGACSFAELRQALETARAAGCEHFVIVSHNFEMLRQGSSAPDRIVVRRFERLCRYLAEHRQHYRVTGFRDVAPPTAMPRGPVQVGRTATARRLVEQALRYVI